MHHATRELVESGMKLIYEVLHMLKSVLLIELGAIMILALVVVSAASFVLLGVAVEVIVRAIFN